MFDIIEICFLIEWSIILQFIILSHNRLVAKVMLSQHPDNKSIYQFAERENGIYSF